MDQFRCEQGGNNNPAVNSQNSGLEEIAPAPFLQSGVSGFPSIENVYPNAHRGQITSGAIFQPLQPPRGFEQMVRQSNPKRRRHSVCAVCYWSFGSVLNPCPVRAGNKIALVVIWSASAGAWIKLRCGVYRALRV